MNVVLGTWSAPPDGPAKIALGLAVAVGVLAWRWPALLFVEGTRRRFLGVAAMAAGLLSIAYVALYLRGGPRIIDATTYFLQGRALSHGDFAWTPLEPTASFRGRFLDYREGSLGGIFPPGYPLLLAIGFIVGAPMVIGPAIAAALVVATYRLALSLSGVGGDDSPHKEDERVARAAALLSVVCAALRYHTADTMSHGATALGIAIALEAALRKRALVAWLAVGYVVATRPVSAVPIAIVAGVLTLRRATLKSLVGLVPGVLLLLTAQHAVTGSWLGSAQRMYYATSDGPTSCFRWGFGAGTGCVFEHGDFVEARLPAGYGIVEALGTTIRRLHHHLLDVASFEPLALLVVVPFVKKRSLAVKAASVVVVGQVLVYLPFYFDGDYPGGGARFFADVLPIEHGLIACGVALVARDAARALHAVLALSLAGFAIHAVHPHVQLRDRDGGPMWSPDVLARASVKNGLVFVDTDHGFALGHDPTKTPAEGIVVARRRDDDRDRLLYERLDRPTTYWYRLQENGPPLLTPWAPPEYGAALRFEGEAEWPALSQTAGFAAPGWTHACASGRRALVLTPEDGRVPATATIEVPVPTSGLWEITVDVAAARIPRARTVNEGPAQGRLTIVGERLEWAAPAACAVIPPRIVTLAAPRVLATLEAMGGPVGLDAVHLRSLGSR